MSEKRKSKKLKAQKDFFLVVTEDTKENMNCIIFLLRRGTATMNELKDGDLESWGKCSVLIYE